MNTAAHKSSLSGQRFAAIPHTATSARALAENASSTRSWLASTVWGEIVEILIIGLGVILAVVTWLLYRMAAALQVKQ